MLLMLVHGITRRRYCSSRYRAPLPMHHRHLRRKALFWKMAQHKWLNGRAPKVSWIVFDSVDLLSSTPAHWWLRVTPCASTWLWQWWWLKNTLFVPLIQASSAAWTEGSKGLISCTVPQEHQGSKYSEHLLPFHSAQYPCFLCPGISALIFLGSHLTTKSLLFGAGSGGGGAEPNSIFGCRGSRPGIPECVWFSQAKCSRQVCV